MKLKLLLFCGLLFALPASATTFYVLPGGTTGNCTNWTDWAHAGGKIPPSPAPGDTIVIGNVVGKNMADPAATPCAGELSHTFSTSGTLGSHITIRGATAALDSGVVGWNASMGVDVNPKITWSNSFILTDGLKIPFWDFCPGSFYDVDSGVGTTDQTGTYGFYFKSQGRMFGFIRADAAICSASITDVNLHHIELDGVSSPSSSVLGVGTVNTDGSTTVTRVSGTSFAASWVGFTITINGLIKTISSVTDGDHLVTSTGVTTGSGVNFTANTAVATGIYLGSPSNVAFSVSNTTFSNSFIHDIFLGAQCAGNCLTETFDHDYIYNVFSDTAQHGNSISNQATSGVQTNVGVNNLTVSNSVFKNDMGTGFIISLGGMSDGWKIYNNLFWYTDDWDTVCEQGDPSAACTVSKALGDNVGGGGLTNSIFYGNTFSGIHIKPGQPGGSSAGIIFGIAASGGGNIAQNNLWWNCTQGDIFFDGSAGHPVLITHDYNAWINTGVTTTTTPAAHDFQIGTAPGGVGVNPFVNSTNGNFALSSETVDAHLNDGNTLSAPYNLDMLGVTRGADGTWERGAFEFVSNVIALAPTSLAFGNQTISTPSSPQVLTLTNNSGSSATSVVVSITGANAGDFSQTNSCPGTLTNTSSCTINVTFTPTTPGARSASVSVSFSGPTGSPLTSSLAGTGIAGASLGTSIGAGVKLSGGVTLQ
jgi:hypothetical protein